MGSFASSLHVHSKDAAAVAESIRKVLLTEGNELTDEEPAEDALWGGPSALRALHVSEARDGWVSVLDSDLMNSMTLAAALSGQLETHALQVMVNDSDSWHYQLYRAGQQIDAFDSSGEEDFDEDDDSAALAGMMGTGDAADLQRTVEERAQHMQAQLDELLPPEIRAIQEQWKAGRASKEDMQKYSQWASAEMPRLMESIKGMLGFSSPAFAGGREATEDRNFQPHIDQLRSLLKVGVPDARVLEVFGARAVFAEETLGDFLELLGISPFYASLSYRYLAEMTEKDLAGESIRLAAHLKFKNLGG